MTGARDSSTARTIRALSLLAAGLLWFSVIAERPGETTVQVPVQPERVPAGLTVESPGPGKVEATVAGPRIVLWLLPFRAVSCGLDLARGTAGPGSYPVQGEMIRLPDRDLRVVAVSPATVAVTLAGAPGKKGTPPQVR